MAFHRRAVLTLLGLFLPTISLAADLGDFKIPAARVPDWYPAPEGGIPDTSTWSVYDVTKTDDMKQLGCGTANSADQSNSSSDTVVIQCAINRVPPKSIVYLPGSQQSPSFYNVFDGQGFSINKSEVVVRCEDPRYAQIRMDYNIQARGGLDGTCLPKDSHVTICSNGSLEPAIAKSGGPDWLAGTRTLKVASTSTLRAGDMIMVRMDNDPSKLDNPGPTGMNAHFQTTVIASIDSATQLTIDRDLRIDFDYEGMRIQKIPFIEHSGLENCGFYWENPNYEPSKNTRGVAFKYAKNTWATGNLFEIPPAITLSIETSARNLVRNNVFKESPLLGDGYRILVFNDGATDNVVENNVFDNADPLMFQVGASGNVAAYNYFVGGEYRQIFFHGRYPAENLVEGNHIEPGNAHNGGWGAIVGDSYWGMQGPRNTLYRNRIIRPKRCYDEANPEVRGPQCATDNDCSGSLTCEEDTASGIQVHTDRDPSEGLIFPDVNIIANAFGQTSTRCGKAKPQWACPRPWDLQLSAVNPWFERNLIRSDKDFVPEPDTTDLDNLDHTNIAPQSWSNFTGPDSLYLPSAPDWWCDEACGFDLQNGIGAFGDDLTPLKKGETPRCKIPAQIWYEGDTCTVSGKAVQNPNSLPPRPDPPRLLAETP